MNKRHFSIVKRQGLGGVLGSVGNIVSDVGSGVNSAVAGVGAGVTSGLGDITSALLPTTTSDTATSITVSTTSTSAASTHSTSSTSSSSTSATPSTSTSVYTSTSGNETITAFVTSSPSSTPTSSSSSGFLNNKPLEGSVFALCGIIVLVIIFVIVTFALRRSRRKRMINEALSYEPTTMHGYTNDMEERGSTEKIRNSYSTTGSSGSGPPVAGSYYNQQAAHGYDHEYPAYAPRSPNPIHDAGRAYVYEGGPYNSQGNNVGGPRLPPQASLPTHANPAAIPRVLAPAFSLDSAAARA